MMEIMGADTRDPVWALRPWGSRAWTGAPASRRQFRRRRTTAAEGATCAARTCSASVTTAHGWQRGRRAATCDEAGLLLPLLAFPPDAAEGDGYFLAPGARAAFDRAA